MNHRLRVLFALLAVVVVIAVPTGVAALQATDLVAAAEPAVEAPPEAAEDEEQPWTARFLAPTVLLLGVVALGGSVLYYGIRIRGRYKVTR